MLGFQLAQRLAHHGAGDPQGLAEGVLDQALTGDELAVEDVLADALDDLLP